MQTEFEVKIKNVNHKKLTDQLISIWAKQTLARTFFKRIAFRHPSKDHNAYVRVRDEGNQVTCTYKEVDRTKEIDAVKEIEFIVNDFDACVLFLNEIGLQQKAYQETYRETWHLNNIQITLDEWPWLKPFIEIEWSNIEQVESAASLLGYGKNDMIFGAVDELYFQELWIPYDIINNMEIITFENPPKKFIQE